MEDIYQRLARHLSSLGMGYPEKDELLEILKENFTPLEAEVALAIPTRVIPFEPAPADEIEPPLQLSRHELEKVLSNLAQRGLLFPKSLKKGKQDTPFSNLVMDFHRPSSGGESIHRMPRKWQNWWFSIHGGSRLRRCMEIPQQRHSAIFLQPFLSNLKAMPFFLLK